MTAKAVGNCSAIALGQDHRLHPDGRGLCEAHLGSGHPADLAPQAHLSDDCTLARHRPVLDRAGDRQCRREVGPGIREADAAGDVDEHVQLAKGRDGPAPTDYRLSAGQSVEVMAKGGERLLFKAFPNADNAMILRTVVWAADVKRAAARQMASPGQAVDGERDEAPRVRSEPPAGKPG